MNISDLQQYYESLDIEDREAIQDEGLFVHDELRPGGYDSSPHGYVAFARTGGDGVHFSLPTDANGPVVMTVPMAFSRPNTIVGSDLHEFLSLGCVYGYFLLEQLSYDMPRAIKAIESAGEQSPALEMLSDHFGLSPWSSVEQRLRELQKTR